MPKKEITRPFLTLFIFIVAVSFLFIISVIYYTDRKINEAYLNWQVRVSMLTDIRVNNIEKWINDKQDTIEAVADNLSIKMYLMQFGNQSGYSDDKIAQEEFLRNYLITVAKDSKFYSEPKADEVRANTPKDSDSSLSVLNKEKDVLISIGYQSQLEEKIRDVILNLNSSKIETLVVDADSSAYMIVLTPVHHVQADEVTGYILGVKKINQEVFSLLNFPPEEADSAKTSILYMQENSLNYISPTPANYAKRILSMTGNTELAEIYAINHLGEIAVKKDQNMRDAIVTAKKIDSTNWYVFYRVDKREALMAAESERASIIMISLLSAAGIILGFLFVWRHSASEKYKRLYSDYHSQNEILRLVTENQIQKMFILDNDGIIRFANNIFAKALHSNADDVTGKYIENVVGPNKANEYNELAAAVQNSSQPLVISKKVDNHGKENFIQIKLIPISEVPILDNYKVGAALVIENDITAIMEERLRNEANLSSIIETLIKIVEERSIYYRDHTKKLTELSVAVAQDLQVDNKMQRAVEVSSKLCNLYLALLPKEILNKSERLNETERKMIEDFPVKTAHLIQDINFDSPVVETIRQIYERVDGNGPAHLHEEQILISARILKVVNDYIAMISPRAYREGFTQEQAINILLTEKDSKYSKKVVYSLANILEKNAD